MNTENIEKLLIHYSWLYSQLKEFNFKCDDGWFNLIRQLSADIESLARLEDHA